MNELFWILLLVVNFTAVMIAFKCWGKLGLYIWIPLSVVVANIQVTKTINLFGLEATLGNIVYASGFLVTDILSEAYGKKSSQRAVNIGFFSLLAMTCLMQIALLFIPSSADIASGALNTIFSFMPRLALGSLAAYYISNFCDINIFEILRNKTKGKYLWIRNCGSTMLSQLIDSAIFTSIAFLGMFEMSVWWQILLSTYLLKFLVALLDTPFMYLAKYWINNNKIKELE